MATQDTWTLQGSLVTMPAVGNPSGALGTNILLGDIETLQAKAGGDLDLNSDAPVVIPFGQISGANILFLDAHDLKVDATVTSTDGTAQIIPVEDLLLLQTRTVPITAVSLTRVPGIATTVTFFLGQYA